MFIDTATANSRSSRPQIVISGRTTPRTSPYNESQTPLLETFVGQAAPPSYLEATTPGLYSSRLSNDQGARLLASDGEREAEHAALKEEQYRSRSAGDQWTKAKCLKWAAAGFAIIMLAAILSVMAAAVSVRRDQQV